MPPTQQTFQMLSSLTLEQHIRGHKIIQSEGDAWADIELQIFRRHPEQREILVPAVAEPLLVWIIAGEALIEERELDGAWRGGVVGPGVFYLTQSQSPYLMRWRAKSGRPFEVMHLYLGLEIVRRAALSLNFKPTRMRIRDVSGGNDAFLSNLLVGLIGEMGPNHRANRLFITGLIDSLTVHLLRNYAEASPATRQKNAQLAAWKLRKALDHMDTHIAKPFDLDSLAILCAMSRYHFSRAFRHTMGQSPSSWFIQRRVAHAKDHLRSPDVGIADVAAMVGYESPSHFAKIFKAATRMSPREYRISRREQQRL
jgi:AraC family transcriptional regulator